VEGACRRHPQGDDLDADPWQTKPLECEMRCDEGRREPPSDVQAMGSSKPYPAWRIKTSCADQHR